MAVTHIDVVANPKPGTRSRPASSCRIAPGALTPNGYGRATVNGVRDYAHRWAFRQANGEIPAGLEVDHICQNRACVEPTHLRLATPQQNRENLRPGARQAATGVRGVTLYRNGRFRAVVRSGSKQVYHAYFDTLAEAQSAVVTKRLELLTHSVEEVMPGGQPRAC